LHHILKISKLQNILAYPGYAIFTTLIPAEIFDEKEYPYNTPTKAKRIRNFFGYQSTSDYDPIGFSGTENIYLGSWDYYDCKVEHRCEVGNADKHRLSILLGMFTVLEIRIRQNI